MHSPLIKWVVVTFVVPGCVVAVVWAQDGVQIEEEQVEVMTIEDEPAEETLTVDEEIEAWMQVSEPGPEHEVLDAFVGVWQVESTIWMAPDAEPTVSQAKSDMRWILGNRFVAEAVGGTMNMGGQDVPFEGFGITGYDKLAEQYVGTWMDSMSTSIISFIGDYDEITQTLTMIGEFQDPMSGQPAVMRCEITFVSDDQIVTKMHQQIGDEPEYQCLELVYTRSE